MSVSDDSSVGSGRQSEPVSPSKRLKNITKSKKTYMKAYVQEMENNEEEDTPSVGGVSHQYSLSIDGASGERPSLRNEGPRTFTVYRTTLLDREVSNMHAALSFQQHLLNALRRFDKYLDMVQTASNEAGTFAATPRHVGAGDNILCSFLEDTRLGRGLRLVVDVMKEVPQSIEGQSLALSVIYYCFVLLLEVREAQTVFDREDLAAQIRERERRETIANVQRARDTKHWGKVRDVLVSPKKKRVYSTQRVAANPMAKLQSTTMKRITIHTVLAVLDQDSYGKSNEAEESTPVEEPEVEVPFSKDSSQPQTAKVEEYDDEESLALQLGGQSLEPRPPPYWLPGTSSSKLEDYRNLGPKQSWKRFGRPIQWVDELLELDMLQLAMAALYNIRDPPVQVQAMAVMELFIELNHRRSIDQILAPMKDFVFFDSSRDPFQSTPKSQVIMRAREESLVARGKIKAMPNGVALILRTCKINHNKFAVQGGVGRLLFALLEKGGATVAHKICSHTAFETMHGLPKMKDSTMTSTNFGMGNIKMAASMGRNKGQQNKGNSSPSKEEAHLNALRERVTEIKTRIRNKFKIKIPDTHYNLGSFGTAGGFVGDISYAGSGGNAGSLVRNKRNKKLAEVSDLWAHDHDDTAAHLLVKMLRRWNLGGERKGKEHTKEYIYSQMAKQDQDRLEEAHLACTRALLCLVDQDHRACLWVRSTPKAVAALQNAANYHHDDAFIRKHNTDLSFIIVGEGSVELSSNGGRSRKGKGRRRPATAGASTTSVRGSITLGESKVVKSTFDADITSKYDPDVSLPSVPGPVCGDRPEDEIFKKPERQTWDPPKQSTKPQGIDRYAFDRLKFDEPVRERAAGGMDAVGIQRKVQKNPLDGTGPISSGLFPSGYPAK